MKEKEEGGKETQEEKKKFRATRPSGAGMFGKDLPPSRMLDTPGCWACDEMGAALAGVFCGVLHRLLLSVIKYPKITSVAPTKRHHHLVKDVRRHGVGPLAGNRLGHCGHGKGGSGGTKKK